MACAVNASYPSCCMQQPIPNMPQRSLQLYTESAPIEALPVYDHFLAAHPRVSILPARQMTSSGVVRSDRSKSVRDAAVVFMPSLLDGLQLFRVLDGLVRCCEAKPPGARVDRQLPQDTSDDDEVLPLLAVAKSASVLSLWARLLHNVCEHLPPVPPSAMAPRPCRATLHAVASAQALQDARIIPDVITMCQQLHSLLSPLVHEEGSAERQAHSESTPNRGSAVWLSCTHAALHILRSMRKLSAFLKVVSPPEHGDHDHLRMPAGMAEVPSALRLRSAAAVALPLVPSQSAQPSHPNPSHVTAAAASRWPRRDRSTAVTVPIQNPARDMPSRIQSMRVS